MITHESLDSKVSLAACSAQRVSSVGSSDGSVVVVPVGSVEQHGRHLPVVTDSLLVSAVATAGARAVCDDVPALVTPAVWLGYSPHHLSFGGTISGEFETLLEVLEQVAETVLENGFDALLFLNGHGGNASLIDTAVSTVGRTHPDAEILGLTYFDLALPFIDDVRESETGGMGHAGEFETSLMLHLHPELVGDEMPSEEWAEPYELGRQDLVEAGPLSVYRPFEEYSASGAIGSAELASAQKGEAIFDGVRRELATLLTDVHEANRSE